MCCSFCPKMFLLLAFLSTCIQKFGSLDHEAGNQEYSSRTLGATWGIISAVMLPIVVVLICIGWRILKRRKEEEKEESEFLPIKTRPIDPDEALKLNSDDDSIPYKKDTTEDSPEPTEGVKVVDIAHDNNPYTYDQYQDDQPEQYQAPAAPEQPVTYQQAQPYLAAQQPQSSRQWAGETEIN